MIGSALLPESGLTSVSETEGPELAPSLLPAHPRAMQSRAGGLGGRESPLRCTGEVLGTSRAQGKVSETLLGRVRSCADLHLREFTSTVGLSHSPGKW